jgi:translation initiation factor eIF-2B subunit epsilon
LGRFIIWYGAQVLPFLYDKEIVSEDAILRWAEEKKHADESDKVFVKQSEAFIQWLKEAEEEDEEEEGDILHVVNAVHRI